MRKRLALTFLGFVCSGVGCGGGGGGDDTAIGLCKDGVGVICANLFQCPGTHWGYSSVADCEAKLGTQDRCKPEHANCATGQTFQPDKAPACVAAYRTTPCLILGSVDPTHVVGMPPPCQEVCATPPP